MQCQAGVIYLSSLGSNITDEEYKRKFLQQLELNKEYIDNLDKVVGQLNHFWHLAVYMAIIATVILIRVIFA